MLALIAKLFPGPQPGHDVEGFIQHPAARLGVGHFAEPGEIVGRAAQPGGKDQPSLRHAVERDGLAGNLPRATARQRREHDAQAEVGRRRGDRGQRNPRVGDGVEVVVVDDGIPEKEAVPARGLGGLS